MYMEIVILTKSCLGHLDANLYRFCFHFDPIYQELPQKDSNNVRSLC